MAQTASPPSSRTRSPGTRQGPLVELLPSSSSAVHMHQPQQQQPPPMAHLTPSHSMTTNATSHGGPTAVPPHGPFAGHKMMMMGGNAVPPGMAVKVPPNMHLMKMPPGMAMPPAGAMRGKMPPSHHQHHQQQHQPLNPAQMMMMMRKGPPNMPPWGAMHGHPPPASHPNSPPLPLNNNNTSGGAAVGSDGRRLSLPAGANNSGSVGMMGGSSVPMSAHSMTPGSSVNVFPAGHSPRPARANMSPPLQHTAGGGGMGRGGRPGMMPPPPLQQQQQPQHLPPSAFQQQKMMMMMNSSGQAGAHPTAHAMRGGGVKVPMAPPWAHGPPAAQGTSAPPPSSQQQQSPAPALSAETSKKPNNGRFNFLRHLHIRSSSNSSSNEDGGNEAAEDRAHREEPQRRPPAAAMQPRWHEAVHEDHNTPAALPAVLPQSPTQGTSAAAAAPRFLPTPSQQQQQQSSSSREASPHVAVGPANAVSKPLGQAMADLTARHANETPQERASALSAPAAAAGITSSYNNNASAAQVNSSRSSVGVPLPAAAAQAADVLVVPPQTSLSNVSPEAGVAARPKKHKASAKHTSSRFGHLILGDSSEDSSSSSSESGDGEQPHEEAAAAVHRGEEQEMRAAVHSAPAVAAPVELTSPSAAPLPPPPLSPSAQDSVATPALSQPVTHHTLEEADHNGKEDEGGGNGRVHKASSSSPLSSSSPSPVEKEGERQTTSIFAGNNNNNNKKNNNANQKKMSASDKKAVSQGNASHKAQSSAAQRSHTAVPSTKKTTATAALTPSASRPNTPNHAHHLHRATQGKTQGGGGAASARKAATSRTPVRHVSPLRRRSLTGAEAHKARPHAQPHTSHSPPRSSSQQQQQQEKPAHGKSTSREHANAHHGEKKAAAAATREGRSVSSSPVRSPAATTAATTSTAGTQREEQREKEKEEDEATRSQITSPLSSPVRSAASSSAAAATSNTTTPEGSHTQEQRSDEPQRRQRRSRHVSHRHVSADSGRSPQPRSPQKTMSSRSKAHARHGSSSSSSSATSASSPPRDDARIAREVYRLYNALRAQEARELDRSGAYTHSRSPSAQSHVSLREYKRQLEKLYNHHNRRKKAGEGDEDGHAYLRTRSPLRNEGRSRSAFLRRAQSATPSRRRHGAGAAAQRRNSLDAWDRRDAGRAFSARSSPSSCSSSAHYLDSQALRPGQRRANASPLRALAARPRRAQPWSFASGVSKEDDALLAPRSAAHVTSCASPRVLPPWRYSGVVDAKLLAAQPSPLRRPLGYIAVGNGHFTPVRHESPYGQKYLVTPRRGVRALTSAATAAAAAVTRSQQDARRTISDTKKKEDDDDEDDDEHVPGRNVSTPLRTAHKKTSRDLIAGGAEARERNTLIATEPLIPDSVPAAAQHPYCITASAFRQDTTGAEGRLYVGREGKAGDALGDAGTQVAGRGRDGKKRSELNGKASESVESLPEEEEQVDDNYGGGSGNKQQLRSAVEDVVVSSVSDTQLRTHSSPSRGHAGQGKARANEPTAQHNAQRNDDDDGGGGGAMREPISGGYSGLRSRSATQPQSARGGYAHKYDTSEEVYARGNHEPVAGHTTTAITTRGRQGSARRQGRLATPRARSTQPLTHYLEQYSEAGEGRGSEPLRSFLHPSRTAHNNNNNNNNNTVSPRGKTEVAARADEGVGVRGRRTTRTASLPRPTRTRTPTPQPHAVQRQGSRPGRDDVITPQPTPPAGAQRGRQQLRTASGERGRGEGKGEEGEKGSNDETQRQHKASRAAVRALIARLAQSPPHGQMPPPAALRNAVLAKAAALSSAERREGGGHHSHGHTTSPGQVHRRGRGGGAGAGGVGLTEATASAACKKWLDELFRSVTPTTATVADSRGEEDGGVMQPRAESVSYGRTTASTLTNPQPQQQSVAGAEKGGRDGSAPAEPPAMAHQPVPVPVVDLRRDFRPCTTDELAQEQQRRRALLDKASRERAARRTTRTSSSPSQPLQPLLSPTPTRQDIHGGRQQQATQGAHTPLAGGLHNNNNAITSSAYASPSSASSPARVPVMIDAPEDGLPFAAYSTFRTKDPGLPSAWALAPARDALAVLPGKPAARRVVTLAEPRLPSDEAEAMQDTMAAAGMRTGNNENDDDEGRARGQRVLVEEVHLDEQMRPYVVLKSVPRGAAAKAQREAVLRLARPRPVYVRADTPDSEPAH